MKEIQLTQGKVALVDDGDYDKLIEFSWSLAGRGYAVAHMGKTRKYMHRFIMNTPKGMETDHIDGNPLNNQRSNLRICTHAENGRHRVKVYPNKNGYKGVYTYRGKYRARIEVNGKRITLGAFDTPKEAALAYDAGAIKYHGEFAVINSY